jgi:hypothetical protein
MAREVGRMKGFDLKQLLPLYEELGTLKYGGTLDFSRLEKIMEPIRLGSQELSAEHLVALKEDTHFPAWWKLPEIKTEELNSLRGLFKNLNPQDFKVIQKLFEVFKNIEIMSCLLRLICPKHYGIYSAPVENLLSIKAETPVKKYLIYLQNLGELQEHYNFERLAEVDMSLWALCCILNEDFLQQNPLYHQIYEEYLKTTNPIKKISARNALQHIRRENLIYLDLAEIFLDTDPEIAGILAGKELEGLVNRLYLEIQVRHKLYPTTKIPEKLDELVRRKFISDQVKDELISWWDTRNKAVHWDLAQAEGWKLEGLHQRVREMIAGLRSLREKLFD